MVRGSEGTKARGRPPRRLQLKQRPPLGPLIPLGTPGSGPPPFLISSRAVGPRISNHKAGLSPDRRLMPAAQQSGETTLAPHVQPRGPAANSAPAPGCHAGGRLPSRGQVQRTWGG